MNEAFEIFNDLDQLALSYGCAGDDPLLEEIKQQILQATRACPTQTPRRSRESTAESMLSLLTKIIDNPTFSREHLRNIASLMGEELWGP